MGKKGDLLRAQKAERSTYTFTRVQLEEHDRMILDQKRDELKRKITADIEAKIADRERQCQELIVKEWQEREKFFKGDNWEDNFFMILSMLLAVSSAVLVKKFHWKPIPKDSYWDKRNRLARFGDAIVEEVNAICSDEMADIRRYCDEVYDLYGVKFLREEDEENEQ